MKVTSRALVAVTIAAGLSTTLAAKGSTSRITISGGDLASSLEIRDPSIVKQFQIWTGPGTQTCVGGRANCVEGTEGFIVNWPAGTVVERPSGLQRYEISFFVVDERLPGQTHHEELAYVVWYEYDPAGSQGFVYLPGKGDRWHELNGGSIYRGGPEGHWFRATRAWQDAVVPLISH